jgi:signal peptidase I
MRSRDYIQIILAALIGGIMLKLFVIDAVWVSSSSMEQTLLKGDVVLVDKLVERRDNGKHSASYHANASPLLPSVIRPVMGGDVIVFKYPGDRDEMTAPNSVEYVKRCVAVAGDTVALREGDLYVNGKYIRFNTNGKRPYFPESYSDERLFPAGGSYNVDFYGPVIVPKSGDVITLTRKNFTLYSKLIWQEGHKVELSADGTIRIDGTIATTYVVERNYLFVLGDNFYNSSDSRFWGFMPEENVVGRAALVYWSKSDPENRHDNSLSSTTIRWDRIGTIVR